MATHVASRAEAWIETSKKKPFLKWKPLSPPVRRRGLKLSVTFM